MYTVREADVQNIFHGISSSIEGVSLAMYLSLIHIYFAVSFSLGIAARKAGFTPFQGFLVSLLNKMCIRDRSKAERPGCDHRPQNA